MITVIEQASPAEARETAIPPAQYVLSRSFILRLTGFPIELMNSFAAPELALAADQCLATRQHVVSQSEALMSSSLRLSRSTRRKLKRCLHPDSDAETLIIPEDISEETINKVIDGLNRILTGEVEIRRHALELYEQELERTRRVLYQFVVGRPFQEVLLLSSPDLGRLGRLTPNEPHPPAVRNSHVRQRELSWISYLQRLTTKNETISFFGPCAWGQFDPQEPAAAAIQLSQQGISERVVYVERWVCESLAQLMSADPEVLPLLQLRLADDLVIQEGQAILLASGKAIAISPPQREFLESCAVSERRSLGLPLAEDLVEQKLLLREVQVPPIPFPFRALEKEVAGWPPHPARVRWQKNLDEIERCREAIERAPDFESRRVGVHAITSAIMQLGLDGCRNSQNLYASRMPINEDCRLGVHRLAIGKPVMEQLLNDAAPWYDLWRDMAGLYATRLHQCIQKSWRSMGTKPVPLPIFWPAIVQAWGQLTPLEEEIQQAWQRQLGDRCHQPLVSLTREDLGFLRHNFSLRRMKAFDNLAPDLQIVAPDAQALSDGRWTLLVAEIHPDFAPWQHCFFHWCPDPEGYARDYAHQGGQGTAVVIGSHPPYFTSAHTALWIYPFAHQWKFVRSAGPEGAQTLRSAETVVEVTEDDVLLRHTRDHVLGSLLHTWVPTFNTHRLQLGGHANHSPRLQVGRVIVQRETWNLEPDAVLRQAAQAGGHKGYAALREFRQKHGLPETVFIRGCLPERLTLDKDIKPVFADFSSPMLMEMVCKMIGRFQRLTITEMLPGIEDCWLEGSEGHYSSEFRTVILASRDSRLGPG
jgi:hypothetical protein